MRLAIGACLSAWFVLCAAGVSAERYYVTQDSFGNLDAEKQEESILEQGKDSNSSQAGQIVNEPRRLEEFPEVKAPEVKSPEISDSEPTIAIQGSESSLLSSSKFEGGPENQQKSVPDADESETSVKVSVGDAVAPVQINSDGSAASQQGEPAITNPFERAFFKSEGRNPYDATVIDEADYVDGDDLEAGRVQRPDQQPFFITRDINGNESITFYSPTLAQVAKEREKTQLRFTEATIYKSEPKVGARLPADADPVALQILMSGLERGESYFESFSRRCCELLPKAGVKVLEFGRSEHLVINEELLPYRFSEGDSRYLIFRLPQSSANYALELRAFIRKYRDEGVENGVFFPQLVTLSKGLKPMRIIANPILEYTPENWSGYGYLQGVFEIDRTENLEEEYVLLNTTSEQLRITSQYDHPESPIEIHHMRFGSMGVKALSPQTVRDARR